MSLISRLFGPQPGRLCDHEIERAIDRHELDIRPFAPGHLQPASYDLTLGRAILIGGAPDWHPRDLIDDGPCEMHPGSFLLAATAEIVFCGPRIVGMINGKSSIGRTGLQVECAGFIDPGFCGTLTLELANLGPGSMLLRPGMPIAQVSFERLSRAARRPYGSPALGSHYQGQMRARSSHLSRSGWRS